MNHEAAHGVPSRLRMLRDGDLVNLDVSAELDGYWADTGLSVDDGNPLVLWEGLVLAIEPFLSLRPTEAVDGGDGWTLVTADGGLAAQHEHTVVVTGGHPLVLTA